MTDPTTQATTIDDLLNEHYARVQPQPPKPVFNVEDYEGEPEPPKPAPDPVEAWLLAYKGDFLFLLDVADQFRRKGRLSDGQRAAIQRCMRRDTAPTLELVNAAPKPPRVVVEELTDEVEVWLASYAGDFEFLTSVRDQFLESGQMTERQRTGVEKCIARERSTSAKAKPSFTVTTRVPAAHYCVPSRSTGKPVFLNVQVPTEGDWEGWMFVKQVIGGRADTPVLTVRPNGGASGEAWVEAVLTDISVDLSAAMATYGQRLGRCGLCHRHLTDPVSEARGIGPECIKKL